MDFQSISDALDEMVANIIEECDVVRGKDIASTGLDPRVGTLYVSRDRTYIMSKTPKTLNYYGGFEYVDPSCVLRIGAATIYSSEDDRVNEVISAWFDQVEEIDE